MWEVIEYSAARKTIPRQHSSIRAIIRFAGIYILSSISVRSEIPSHRPKYNGNDLYFDLDIFVYIFCIIKLHGSESRYDNAECYRYLQRTRKGCVCKIRSLLKNDEARAFRTHCRYERDQLTRSKKSKLI